MKPDTDQTALVEFEANYEAFIRCGLQASVFADEGFLREAGMYAQIEAILEASGWKSLLTLRCAANVEDTCEFLASVEQRGKYMRYRHRGVYYCASKKRLKHAFGWTTSRRDETDQHFDDEAWGALTWSDKKFRAGITRFGNKGATFFLLATLDGKHGRGKVQWGAKVGCVGHERNERIGLWRKGQVRSGASGALDKD